MACWEIFVPENAYSDSDKEQISDAITSIYVEYAGLPRFYVVVIFHDQPSKSVFVGGSATNNLVRIRVDHIARQLETAEARAVCMAVIEQELAPYVRDRGFDWEIHINETPMDLWRIQGLVPPPPESEMERIWANEDRPIPYDQAY
jgi:phenylpyruvate tautomerase PptA (4-oxalocrotonate tautomerase family)